MKKIYIVTSGEYSDYNIDAVFSTREKAEEYIQQHGTQYQIEPHGVDEEVKKNNNIWWIDMRLDNFELQDCGIYQSTNNYTDKDKDIFKYIDGWNGKGVICQYIEADCMDRAIKIASERMAQIKANKDIFYARAFSKTIDPYFGILTYPRVRYRTGEIVK
jgi:hypothetical protein